MSQFGVSEWFWLPNKFFYFQVWRPAVCTDRTITEVLYNIYTFINKMYKTRATSTSTCYVFTCQSLSAE